MIGMVRLCKECNTDISDRHHNALFCKDCISKHALANEIRQREKTKNGIILSGYYGSTCNHCGDILTPENTWISRAVHGERCCKKCSNKRVAHVKKHGYDKARISLIIKLGSICNRCGYSDIRALQIDHINGHGRQDVKSKGGHRQYIRILDRMPLDELKLNYQLLCANCNYIKRHENYEFKL